MKIMDIKRLLAEDEKLNNELSEIEKRINQIRLKQISEPWYAYSSQDLNDFKRAEEIKSRRQEIENLIKTNNEK